MTTKTYLALCKELSTLVDDLTHAIGDVPEAQAARAALLPDFSAEADGQTAAEPVPDLLRRLRDKLAEDCFRVALVADFQNGKSTTFNIFMGGEEIAPRGTQTVTSATLLCGQHSDDPALQGKARITWKSDEELIQMLPAGVFAQLKGMTKLTARLKKVDTLDQLSQVLHLDNKADLAALREACEAEWKVYASNHGKYNEADFSLLRVAYVMLRKVDTPAIREARANLRLIPIEEVAELVRFPEKWDLRFNGETPEPFDDAECRFIFVKKVECFVKSPALKKAGCTIVDCPGLFSSTYDTKVTLEEIKGCDAVWFLMGDKQASEEELNAIKRIADIKPNGLLFSVNIRKETKKLVTEQILPVDCARINQRITREDGGDLVSEKAIFPYHARLALTAEQAQRVGEGALTQHSMDAILHNTRKMVEETDDVREALTMAAENDLKRVGVPRQELRGFTLFDEEGNVIPEAVALMHERSNFGAIVDTIEGIVARDRPQIVLKDNGIMRLRAIREAISREIDGKREALTQTIEATKKNIAEKKKSIERYFIRTQDEFWETAKESRVDRTLETKLRQSFKGYTLGYVKNKTSSYLRLNVDQLLRKGAEMRDREFSQEVNKHFFAAICNWVTWICSKSSESPIVEYQKELERIFADLKPNWPRVCISAYDTDLTSILNSLDERYPLYVFCPAPETSILDAFFGDKDRKRQEFIADTLEILESYLDSFLKEFLPSLIVRVINKVKKQNNLIVEKYFCERKAKLTRSLCNPSVNKKATQELKRLDTVAARLEAFDAQLAAFEERLSVAFCASSKK